MHSSSTPVTALYYKWKGRIHWIHCLKHFPSLRKCFNFAFLRNKINWKVSGNKNTYYLMWSQIVNSSQDGLLQNNQSNNRDIFVSRNIKTNLKFYIFDLNQRRPRLQWVYKPSHSQKKLQKSFACLITHSKSLNIFLEFFHNVSNCWYLARKKLLRVFQKFADSCQFKYFLCGCVVHFLQC